MNQELWNVIKLFTQKEEIGVGEIAIARESLDTDVFLVLKEQMEKGLKMSTNQWV